MIFTMILPYGRDARFGSNGDALTTWSMEESIERLRRHNVGLVHPPVDRGFARMAAFTDPDGNIVELTELSHSWLEYLAERREEGHDVIAQWKERN